MLPSDTNTVALKALKAMIKEMYVCFIIFGSPFHIRPKHWHYHPRTRTQQTLYSGNSEYIYETSFCKIWVWTLCHICYRSGHRIWGIYMIVITSDWSKLWSECWHGYLRLIPLGIPPNVYRHIRTCADMATWSTYKIALTNLRTARSFV